MKFMISWQIPREDRHKMFEAFGNMSADDLQADLGPDVRMIGRWHDLARGTGVCILESDNLEALSCTAMNWNHGLEFDVTPVLDDVEAIRAIQTHSGAHAHA